MWGRCTRKRFSSSGRRGVDADVVIVGDGPVGMVLELLLTKKFNVKSVFRSRSPNPTPRSRHPRAHVLNYRTMEVLRYMGLSNAVSDLSEPHMERWRRYRYCTGMIGRTMSSVDHMNDEKENNLTRNSPECVAHVSQPYLETILRENLSPTTSTPDDLEFESYRCVEEDDSIRVRFRDGTEVRTKYLVGADGAHSLVRQCAGLKMNGKERLERFTSVHFRAPDLWDRMSVEDAAMLSFVMNSKTLACVVAHSFEAGEYVAQLPLFDHITQYDKNELNVLISSCIGDESVPFEIESALEWSMSALVANSFSASQNRVFLVGDAAHVLPPSGGFGLNTGIQDAHNLAFKLARAIENEDTSMLTSYDSERRPVAIRNARVGVENYERGLLVPKAIGLSRDVLTSASSVLPSWLVSTGVTMGLKALSVLESTGTPNPVASVMSNQIDNVARVKRDAIPMLFPNLDLGFRYGDDGKKKRRVQTAGFEGDELYDYDIQEGRRFPHSWIMKDQEICSTLDLVREVPIWVVNGAKNIKHDEMKDDDVVVVIVKTPLEIDDVDRLEKNGYEVVYCFQGTRDDITFRREENVSWKAFMVRPDGHISRAIYD